MSKTTLLASLTITLCALCSAQAGELIDVGDHKLAIARSGKGFPTVVLESGAGSDINSWTVILPRVGELTSAIAYARAGRGDSEPAKTPRTLATVVEELRTFLLRAGCKPPYVLVGRSLGSIYVRAFAITHPAEVAGLILVDGTHERQGIEFARVSGMASEKYAEMWSKSLKGEKSHATRLEMEGLQTVFMTGELGISGKLPNVPMVIITNTQPQGPPAVLRMWRNLQDELFQSTSRGMHIVTDKSGHDIAAKEPDIVVNAVRWVVNAVREEPQANSK